VSIVVSLVYPEEMRRMNKSEKFWDKQAENYAKQQQNIQLTDNKDFVNTLKYLNINDMVLDYGCGAGIVSNAIADKVKEIHAIDISSKMIEIAKRITSERNIENVNYAQATIFDERYQKESFNVILAFRILHMLEDTQVVMGRINELLKPGGVFISVTTCMGEKKWAFLSILVFLASKMRIVPQHINMFKLSELEGLMTRENFQIVEYERLKDSVPHYFIVAKKV
jgi:2-polyprenyl-3-methyl-5-hydroxy-6-metoxy-1,4-benzoquinol methylase